MHCIDNFGINFLLCTTKICPWKRGNVGHINFGTKPYFHFIKSNHMLQFDCVNHLYPFSFFSFQDETPKSKSPTALTIYIIGCLSFMLMAILYYGLILYWIRKPKKVSNGSSTIKEKDEEYGEDQYIKIDRFMFVVYIISFLIYNMIYFLHFIEISIK